MHDQIISQFIQLCLRGRWDPAALQAARDLAVQNDLDWEVLYKIARSEYLRPLLFKIVRGQNLVPPRLEQSLHQDYNDLARHNLFLFHELGIVLHHLETKDVPVIVLKGAALAETVYHNIAVRPMGDFDLLVRPEHMPTAQQVLLELGYKLVPYPPHVHTSEAVLRKQARATLLLAELHWSLFFSPHYQRVLDMDWFWQTAQPFSVEGIATQALCPEAQLLHLCGHLLIQHRDAGEPELLRLHDVAEVIFCYEGQIDWGLLLTKTQEYDLVLPVQQILKRVSEEWGAPIPSGVLDQLNSLQPSHKENQVAHWISAMRISAVAHFWDDLASKQTWAAKLSFVWRTLFPPAGFMKHSYRIPHRALLPAFYLYRIVGGLKLGLDAILNNLASRFKNPRT